MKQPKVSVIIPVYNTEPYLRQCLDSVVDQTLRDIEIICVDDGSTDGSLSVLREYEKEDKRVRVISQENRGVSSARNQGILHANGDYVAFVDADDYVEEDAYEKAYRVAKQRDADIVVFGGRCFPFSTWADGTLSTATRSYRGNAVHALFYERGSRPFSYNKIIRLQMLKNNAVLFDESLQLGEDQAFMFDLFPLADSVEYMEEVFYHYRQRESSAMARYNGNRDDKVQCHVKLVRHICDAWRKNGYTRAYGKELAEWMIDFLYSDLQHTRYNCKRTATQEITSFISSITDVESLSPRHREQYEDMKRMIDTPYTPRVTVVMPSLNVGPYIRECMESVVRQTLWDIEILCVDAGSTDGTLEVLQEYAAADSRITLLHSDRKSYGYQMNLGIAAARGEYVGVVETDDYIEPEMYEVLYSTAKSNDLDVVKSDFRRFTDRNGSRIFTAGVIGDKDQYGKIMDPSVTQVFFHSGKSIFTWAGIYSTRFLREHHILHNETPGASYQDNGFWFQVFCRAKRMMFIQKELYNLRRDNPNSSCLSTAKVYCACEEYDFIRSYLGTDAALEQRFAAVCAYMRMRNYDFTLTRIPEADKPAFLRRYAEDFRKIEAAGELEQALFTEEQWRRLRDIMECPEYVYYYEYYKNGAMKAETTGRVNALQNELAGQAKRAKELQDQLERQKKRADALQRDLDCVHRSASFRLGRAVTWLPRKLRGGVRCLRDHGLGYTLRRALYHAGLRKGEEEQTGRKNV